MGKSWLQIVLTLLFAVSPVVTLGASYQISLSGDDSNNGIDLPFRTIAFGCSQLAEGDSLIIQSGNYGLELDIILSASGTEGDPIVVMAEVPGSVFLNGTREPDDLDGGGEGLIIRSSFVRIEGLNFSNYSVAAQVDGDPEGNMHHHEFVGCEFKTNGGVGLQNVRNDFVLVSQCRFIDDYSPDPAGVSSIQDYGVNFYWNSHIRVEDCYFFGNHHQSISFKKNNTDGLVTGCVFEGARYTAIFFGQDLVPDRLCHDLTAEYNVVRPSVGHPVKTPVNVGNVENAVVRYNYFEGFDGAEATGRSGGVLVWSIATGIQQVYSNILAFSTIRPGFIIEEGVADSILVYHNTLHSLDTDAYVNSADHLLVANNLSSSCSGSHLTDYGPCFVGEAAFRGPLVQAPFAETPRYLDHTQYYSQLTRPFGLSAASLCIDTGTDLGLLPFLGLAPDMGAKEFDPGLSPISKIPSQLAVHLFPNPFNPRTSISFALDQPAQVSLDIFDARGRFVRSLLAGETPAGPQTVTWNGLSSDGRAAAAGVYFYRLLAGEKSARGKMVLVD